MVANIGSGSVEQLVKVCPVTQIRDKDLSALPICKSSMICGVIFLVFPMRKWSHLGEMPKRISWRDFTGAAIEGDPAI